ncbi:hypothetical protein DFP96_101668 [Listeria rocourtiae]|uniref:YjcQ protein n=1 Tax=Listeria rocourtiae TaxID=647910 RepID=A0A4R6ZSX3_9LIST|nr:hypothetical protein PROCOU_10136 [Listeria rocourtiae FSL F6-920]TDR55725.1 hypothetical protein DFP96_101668 [Listeria rocourtiae]
MYTNTVKEKLCALSLLKHLEIRSLSLQEAKACRYHHLDIYTINLITYVLDILVMYGMIFSQIDHTDVLYYITPQGSRLLSKLDNE